VGWQRSAALRANCQHFSLKGIMSAAFAGTGIGLLSLWNCHRIETLNKSCILWKDEILTIFPFSATGMLTKHGKTLTIGKKSTQGWKLKTIGIHYSIAFEATIL
jgi:hypothetical protein